MYAIITVDETMDIQCGNITSSQDKAKKWYNDYKLRMIKANNQDFKVELNEWVSKDGRDRCMEVKINGRFYELMKVCKRP